MPVSTANASNTHRAVQEALTELLRAYFDGGTHSIGTDPDLQNLSFPEVEIGYEDHAPGGPPADGGKPLIHFSLVDDDRPERMPHQGGKTKVHQIIGVQFYISFPKLAPSSKIAMAKCRTAAELLKALFTHEAVTQPLARYGLHRIIVTRNPRSIGADGRYLRMMTIQITASYQVQSVD